MRTERIQEFIHLPDEEETFPSLVIRRCAEENGGGKQVFHKHPLILQDGRSNMSSSSSEGDLVCDVCIQPIISSPFYRCQSDGCHFLAHHICANNLPSRLTFIKILQYLRGVLQDSDSIPLPFNSVFPCMFCYRPSNGLAYEVLWEEFYRLL